MAVPLFSSVRSGVKNGGISIVRYIDSDKVEERQWLRCVHCGFTWELKPGSGRRRGLCLGKPGCCNGGVTCGRVECEQEQMIEHIDAEHRLDVKSGRRGVGTIKEKVLIDVKSL